jgi:hypothetical protein
MQDYWLPTLEQETKGPWHQKLCAATTGFHQILEQLTEDLPFITTLLDGLVVHSPDPEEHLQHPKALL